MFSSSAQWSQNGPKSKCKSKQWWVDCIKKTEPIALQYWNSSSPCTRTEVIPNEDVIRWFVTQPSHHSTDHEHKQTLRVHSCFWCFSIYMRALNVNLTIYNTSIIFSTIPVPFSLPPQLNNHPSPIQCNSPSGSLSRAVFGILDIR